MLAMKLHPPSVWEHETNLDNTESWLIEGRIIEVLCTVVYAYILVYGNSSNWKVRLGCVIKASNGE